MKKVFFSLIAIVFTVFTALFVANALPPGYLSFAHYDEKLTETLNSQPYRPDWDGPAPLYYRNVGDPNYFGSGAGVVTVGVGDPYGEHKVDIAASWRLGIYEQYAEKFAINYGNSTTTVTYDPVERKFRAYYRPIKQSDFLGFFGLKEYTLAYETRAVSLALDSFNSVLAGEKVWRIGKKPASLKKPSRDHELRIAELNEKFR